LKIDWVKGKETAKEFLGKITEWFKAFAADMKKTCVGLAGQAGPLKARLLQKTASFPFPAEKKRPLIFVAGGLAALLLLIVITAAALNSRRPREGDPVTRALHHIPPEELFIPAEPDFVPDFLLERDPRHFWSIEDIRPYWRIPANPEFWQDVIRSAVDELMESVP